MAVQSSPYEHSRELVQLKRISSGGSSSSSNVTSTTTSSSQSYNTTCTKTVVADHSYYCAAIDQNVTVHCNGSISAVVTTVCPSLQWQPTCTSASDLLGPGLQANCSVLSYNDTFVTCSCLLLPGERRRRERLLAQSANTTDASNVEVSFVSLLQSTFTEMGSTWTSAGSLTTGQVVKSIRVLVTVVAVGVLGLAAAIAGCVLDRRDAMRVDVDAVSSSFVADPVGILMRTPSQHGGGALRALSGLTGTDSSDAMSDAINKHLPAAYQYGSMAMVFLQEIKKHHRWFSVAMHYSPTFPRVLRVASIVSSIILMLFAQALRISGSL